jgi:hypothetical protein
MFTRNLIVLLCKERQRIFTFKIKHGTVASLTYPVSLLVHVSNTSLADTLRFANILQPIKLKLIGHLIGPKQEALLCCELDSIDNV